MTNNGTNSMSNLDDLTTLETRITAAKAEASKAEGAIAQLEAQGEKEFGVKTLEEAKALEAELTETVADLGKKYDAAVVALKVAYSEAVGA